MIMPRSLHEIEALIIGCFLLILCLTGGCRLVYRELRILFREVSVDLERMRRKGDSNEVVPRKRIGRGSKAITAHPHAGKPTGSLRPHPKQSAEVAQQTQTPS